MNVDADKLISLSLSEPTPTVFPATVIVKSTFAIAYLQGLSRTAHTSRYVKVLSLSYPFGNVMRIALKLRFRLGGKWVSGGSRATVHGYSTTAIQTIVREVEAGSFCAQKSRVIGRSEF